MDVMIGENLYALTKRDNFFVQTLAKFFFRILF